MVSLLDPREKAWTEFRMQKLSKHFGERLLLHTHVDIPPQELLDAANTEQMLQYLCERLGIERFRVELLPPREIHGPAWEIQQDLVGTQLRVYLPEEAPGEGPLLYKVLGNVLCESEVHHMMPEVDSQGYSQLLMVYRGLGIVPANLTGQEGQSSLLNGYNLRTALPVRVIAYALALFAWVRGEFKPDWRKALRPDAQHVVMKSLKYLKKTDDSFFHTAAMGVDQREHELDQVLTNLSSRSESRQILGLWSIPHLDRFNLQLIPPLRKLLQKAHPSVGTEALKATALLGENGRELIPQLEDALRSNNPEVQAAAVLALSRLKHEPGLVLPEVVRMLRSQHRVLTEAAVHAFENYGPTAAEVYPDLMSVLKTALVQCNNALAERILLTVRNTSDHPQAVLEESLEQEDPEILSRAIFMLKELDHPQE